MEKEHLSPIMDKEGQECLLSWHCIYRRGRKLFKCQ